MIGQRKRDNDKSNQIKLYQMIKSVFRQCLIEQLFLRPSETQTETELETGKERERDRKEIDRMRHIDKETEKHLETERDIQTDRETEGDKERDKQTTRHRDRHRGLNFLCTFKNNVSVQRHNCL